MFQILKYNEIHIKQIYSNRFPDQQSLIYRYFREKKFLKVEQTYVESFRNKMFKNSFSRSLQFILQVCDKWERCKFWKFQKLSTLLHHLHLFPLQFLINQFMVIINKCYLCLILMCLQGKKYILMILFVCPLVSSLFNYR